ncbi:MAG: M56 family metallopeptidase [Kofleriaceae bacterium]
MSLGSLVGFGVLAVLLMTMFSLVSAAVVVLAREPLRRAGPAAERRAMAWALGGPSALCFAIVVLLAARGSGGVDHCIDHRHHAHLCLVHGAEWLERPWAVALAIGSAITMLLRFGVVILRHVRTTLAVTRVRKVAQLVGGVRIARSDRSFVFVAGWRSPEVFVSSRAWEVLSSCEREAVLAHEHAHVAHGDLWLRSVLDVAGVFTAPLVGSWLHAWWADASERLCDVRAAERTGPETVASALVRLARAGTPQLVPSGFTPAAEALDRRVRGVLRGGPTGERVAHRVALLGGVLLLGLIGIVAVLAPALHHALETLLG